MYSVVKRIMDFLASLVVLFLLTPLLLPIMIILRLTGEGEIFYLQKRRGYKNKYFNIIKFATMLKASPSLGTGSITLRDDYRVLPIGKYLRKTKINELPQIINVLIGDMSLVGPRPLVDRTFEAYPQHIQERVYDRKPGITGIGSVIFRDEERMISQSNMEPHEFYRKVIAPYKGALELWYQQHVSFWTDLKIIFLTIWVVLFPDTNLPYQIFKNLPKRNF